MGSSAENFRKGLIGAVVAWLPAAVWAGACDPARVDLRGDFGQARFSVEIADDAAERSRGLMYREAETLPRMGGMLFVYEHPQRTAFWMKNTPLPLDILFFDATGHLTRMVENAVPFDETALPGGDAVQFVLEIHGGMAEKLGIAPGAEMRHPAVGPDASWPCDD